MTNDNKLQEAVDRLLPAIQAVGDPGRPILAEVLQMSAERAMDSEDDGGLTVAAVLYSLRDVVLAVHELVGEHSG